MVDREELPFGAEPTRFVRACIHLRAKTQYYRLADQEQPPGMIAQSDTLAYWCARTEDHIGPDQEGCDPRRCQAGRACHAEAADSI